MLADSSIASPESRPKSRTTDHNPPVSFEEVLAVENGKLGGAKGQRSALCISGGGIRSATFALGALQGLADLGILENFDYLSTVSGGGYIGSWLTAWKEREGGLEHVIPKLKPGAGVTPGAPDPVGHLREYNNYLSPKLGFFSADTWTLVATVARNMFLNWLVFVPLMLFFLMLPRIVLSAARLGETFREYPYPIAHILGGFHYVLPIAGGLLFAVGIFNVVRYLPSAGNKSHTEADFLRFCLAPFVLAAVSLVSMDAWFTGGDKQNPLSITFTQLLTPMIISGMAGWLGCLVTQGRKLKISWKVIPGLTAAILLTVLSLAGACWLLTSEQFRYLSWPVYVTIALPLLLLAFALAITLFTGLTSGALKDEDREWLARAGAWILLTILTWTAICGLVLVLPEWAFQIGRRAEAEWAAAGGLSGIIAALAGLSSKTVGRASSTEQNGGAQDTMKKVLDVAGKLAVPIFILVFLTSLSFLTNWIIWKTGRAHSYWKDHSSLVESTRTEQAVALAAIFLAFSWIMARYININKFSLQAMYRSRLIRAYVGASNPDSTTNSFTGFADNDNLTMAKLRADLKPFHVVNLTLNLVSGERLAWQQRKAQSFTVSPLYCGYGDSYRPAAGYAGGITLGTAISLSGAAASPNMGYHSSPAMTFVMTLFNARLGAWLGNPTHRRWTDEGPKSAFHSIVREALGMTNATSPYVYLSDGGHFENLALYEMVRRRCRYIVVLDGGADPDNTYDDLGNALRKIRIDLNVTIRFEEPFLIPLRKPETRCAIATIHYKDLDPTLDNGYLIYVKPAVLGSEPPDVTSYKAAHEVFPHESTADQWFSESQTESYRMLGLCSIQEIFKTWDKSESFEGVVESARRYLHPVKEGAALAAGAGKP